ncbi:sialate O-acetylesterase [Pseudochryseolinea flava]|uniref:Sialate O-acetylesterase n=1 Tax=Pseudochryseolinea flava TaxID=2059302 RepID=A0A364XYM3_9BACT|nr:sialate O-acetylesterase [Pseudochryseolinea flava]RAV98903.1 sialate O-acetylesterase [Pseudochryseolinea flava]
MFKQSTLRRYIFIALFLKLVAVPGFCQVKLPHLFSDGVVLQRGTNIVLWGWASPGEVVTAVFDGKQRKTKATQQGTWKLLFPSMNAGGPYTMKVKGKNEIIVKDVLVGDVWLCAGQSNMVHQMDIHDVTYADEIATANYPHIRQFKVPTQTALSGVSEDVKSGSWQLAVGEQVRPFSAVAYFFAKKIYEKYRVPIGLINSSVGGTPIESWINEEGFKEFPAILKVISENKDTTFVIDAIKGAAGNRGSSQSNDKGLTAEDPWYAVNFHPAGWRNINIPGYWEDQGIRDLNGVVWYRKEIDLPASMQGHKAKVLLGRIIDADKLYINGKEVGSTSYQYPQRRYNIPDDVLKAGKNIFVIRVVNHFGKGGFVPDKPYYIFSGRDTVELMGTWQYKVGEVFDPQPMTSPEKKEGRKIFSLQNEPTALYNGMVGPYKDFPLKGVLWYQGESNISNADRYENLLRALVNGWRIAFQKNDLPVVYAQLPNFGDVSYTPVESSWAILRAAQLNGLSMHNTAMTVNIDLGEWNDIHPDNKKSVGERMALAAQKIAYREDVVYSGPLYASHKIAGNKIVISFSHVGGGLITNDGDELSEFAIAASDKKFVRAQAKIDGDQVIVWSEVVAEPKYVRYGWSDNPDNPNLYNQEGLPASPFETK